MSLAIHVKKYISHDSKLSRMKIKSKADSVSMENLYTLRNTSNVKVDCSYVL